MAGNNVTRGRFVATSVAALGAVALPANARAVQPATKTQAIFKLVPNGATCKACGQHDANALFPTHKAANGNRAHIGCNCTIVQGQVDYGTFVALFGNPQQLESYRVDRRSTRVRAILSQHEPVFPAG